VDNLENSGEKTWDDINIAECIHVSLSKPELSVWSLKS